MHDRWQNLAPSRSRAGKHALEATTRCEQATAAARTQLQLIVQPTRRARGGAAAWCAHPRARDGADELGHLAELLGDVCLLEALQRAVQSQPISGSGNCQRAVQSQPISGSGNTN